MLGVRVVTCAFDLARFLCLLLIAQVYGCHQEDSDYDFICAVEGISPEDDILLEIGELNLTLIHRSNFELLLKENVLWIVMCFFLPDEFKLKETVKFKWELLVPALQKVHAKHVHSDVRVRLTNDTVWAERRKPQHCQGEASLDFRQRYQKGEKEHRAWYPLSQFRNRAFYDIETRESECTQ